ncbi:MAG: hypothetical protein Terrestrivirus4_99 [Terrestrivirus sp.]|uniref:Uncharacterized protein n=1 Tax=Terrestrivirus sp. TaxID=2487775 RepID=A0A3G4ZPZ6_9VIRU|nr:MAG: hypothetical protein Terrestrivirus4_99 [Terrestrivirus sp.]
MTHTNIYTQDSFPPLGVSDSTITKNNNKTISLKNINVSHGGSVFIETNINLLCSSSGINNVLIDVLRDGKSICSGSGNQNLIDVRFLTKPSINKFSQCAAFNIVDTDINCGQYDYDIVLSLADNSNPVDIISYSIVARSIDKANISVNQQFSPLGSPVLTLPSSSSKSFVVYAPKLKNKCNKNNKIRLVFNFNFIAEEPQFQLDIVRDDNSSVIGGTQTILNFPVNLTPVASTVEVGINFSVVDDNPLDSYTFILTNASPLPASIDFFSIVAELVDVSRTQEFPSPLTGDALTIQPYSLQTIPVNIFVKCPDSVVKLTFVGNLNIVGAANFLYNIRSENRSLMNGPQLSNFFGASNSMLNVETNSTVMTVDEYPYQGNNTYYIDIISISNHPQGIDYYCFTAEQ